MPTKLGQAEPWRENQAGQKVKQPNGEVKGPEGWCEWGMCCRKQNCDGEKEHKVYVDTLACNQIDFTEYNLWLLL